MDLASKTERVGRRTFLGMLTAGVASVGVFGCAGSPGARAGRLPTPIGVQLYTVRRLMEIDVARTLAAVAAIGYREVETAGFFDLAPRDFRALLEVHGLVSPAGHYSIEALREDEAGVLATAAAVGQRWVVIPWLPEPERSADGYQRLAAHLNRLGAVARSQDLRIGYHNHDFEFEDLGGDRNGFEILMGDTDPALVEFELDLFWAAHAGQDPVALLERFPGRFPLAHLKDRRAADGQQVPVGDGNIDFGAIFARAELAGLRHSFVEQDEPADPLANIRSSYEFLDRLTF